MGELKTKKNNASVAAFIKSIPNEQMRKDANVLLKMFSEITGEKPVMWGTSIIGYGDYHYKYASGREGDWMLVGFSPRKANLSLYIHPRNVDPKLLKQLGPNTPSMGCLYIKRLSDVNLKILKKVVKEGYLGLKRMQSNKQQRGPSESKARKK